MSLVGDLASNRDRIMRLFAGPVLRTCVQYSIGFYSRPEAAIDVMSSNFVRLNVRDEAIKFRDLRLNGPQTVGGGISPNNLRPDVASDVTGVAVDPVGMDVRAKFNDSRLSRS